ncbi:hypothetical protein EGM30_05230 [Salmonella enterica subsp. enterica]|nr:hypothetical protein [Salmonella enterica subsp. enterica serovar Lisboa]
MADNKNRLESILSRFDADWTASDEARREAKNDLFFSRVSQWDDWLSQYTTLQYRGQFDVVRPVVRKLVSEMRQNPIDVLYRPKDGASPDAADVLMGMYRTDMRHNTAKIAVNIAVREQIEAGVGAWRLVTDYEDQSPTSNNQVIRREPIHSACSHVIWDSNSKLMDKSDARHCTVIHSMSQNGWEDFAEKYDLDADDIPSYAFISHPATGAPSVYIIGSGQASPIATASIEKIIRSYTAEELATGIMETLRFDSHELLIIHLPRHVLVYDASSSQNGPQWCVLKTGLYDDVYRAIDFMYEGNQITCGDKSEAVTGQLQFDISSQYDKQQEHLLFTPIFKADNARCFDLEVESSTGVAQYADRLFLSATTDGINYGREQMIEQNEPFVYDKRVIWKRVGRITAAESIISSLQADYVSKSATASQSLASPLNVTTSYSVGGTKVIGARQTGWTAATGAALLGAFNANQAYTVSATYTQSEVSAMATGLQQARQRIKALEDAIRTHGLIN